ncbi:MAG: glycerophosphodiester phosphodiesterase family protein [Spirochaetota bacterium]
MVALPPSSLRRRASQYASFFRMCPSCLKDLYEAITFDGSRFFFEAVKDTDLTPRPYYLFKYESGPSAEFTIIAHRGASAYYPENTLVSFEAAIQLGAEMVELDVRLSRDGEVVVFHDDTLSRCTDGRGKTAACTLVELKRLDAGIRFGTRFKDTRIPTLEEVLSLCHGSVAVNIEIKAGAVTGRITGGIEEKCLGIVTRAGMDDHVVFSSFEPRALRHLREIDGNCAVAVLYDKKRYGPKLPSEIISALEADAFNCDRREMSTRRLRDAKKNGISINVYTVNDARGMRGLLRKGVEGIFTNRPDVLKTVVDAFGREAGQAKGKQE